MNLEDLKTLKELHQLLQIGAITADDFNVKKNEILQLQSNISAEDRIELLKELHQEMQESVISQEDFDAIKQKLLNTTENDDIEFFVSNEKEKKFSNKSIKQEYVFADDVKTRKILAVVFLGIILFIVYWKLSNEVWREDTSVNFSNVTNNDCGCDESDVRRIANSMIREIENAQYYVESSSFVDVSLDNIRKNSDCSYTAVFKIQNNGERVAGWDTAQTVSKTINCK